MNHLQHADAHNSLQELSYYISESSWDKTGIEIVPVGLLVFHCVQGVSALGMQTRK